MTHDTHDSHSGVDNCFYKHLSGLVTTPPDDGDEDVTSSSPYSWPGAGALLHSCQSPWQGQGGVTSQHQHSDVTNADVFEYADNLEP